MEELREDAVQRMLIKSEVKYMQEIRENFSKQADEIIEKVKRGEKATNLDYFILITTDQKKIDQAIKFDGVKERISKGRIEYSDIDFLINQLGNVGEFNQALRKAFYKRADEVNLTYAQTHPEEFTDEEIQERINKVDEYASMKEIIEENLL